MVAKIFKTNGVELPPKDRDVEPLQDDPNLRRRHRFNRENLCFLMRFKNHIHNIRNTLPITMIYWLVETSHLNHVFMMLSNFDYYHPADEKHATVTKLVELWVRTPYFRGNVPKITQQNQHPMIVHDNYWILIGIQYAFFHAIYVPYVCIYIILIIFCSILCDGFFLPHAVSCSQLTQAPSRARGGRPSGHKSRWTRWRLRRGCGRPWTARRLRCGEPLGQGSWVLTLNMVELYGWLLVDCFNADLQRLIDIKSFIP